MDDWLGRSGPSGSDSGFCSWGVLLLPVGYVYGQWVQRLPGRGRRSRLHRTVFPPVVSYFTGWMMLLAYFMVCPWEAVAVGNCGVHFSIAEFVRIVTCCGATRFFAAPALGIALNCFSGAY